MKKNKKPFIMSIQVVRAYSPTTYSLPDNRSQTLIYGIKTDTTSEQEDITRIHGLINFLDLFVTDPEYYMAYAAPKMKEKYITKGTRYYQFKYIPNIKNDRSFIKHNG